MKAIVTGATGGLGRNLVEFLLQEGWEVIALGRNKEIGDKLKVKFHSFDLSNKELTIKYFENADIVFHCAAFSSPWGNYDFFYNANVITTKNVIDVMKLYSIKKLVHVSTPSIYFDFTNQYNVKENYISKKFVNNYAKTKYEAEQVVLNSDIESVIIRPRGIFGEYDQVLVPRLEKIANKGSLPLVRNRNVIVDVTYVGNVVHALFLAATKDIPNKSIFNITNDEPMNIKDIFTLVMKSINIDVKFRYISYTLLICVAGFLEGISKLKLIKEPIITKYSIGVISNSQILDISSAKKVLGYKPVYTIEEGLKKYAKYRNL
ncbi:SDR family NAD(P)-dependent oxidoreductase [Sulfurimonas sp.]|uniref:NAD-dependent epimerase/dehydratase family protein n=1 Tax=Sulfurimonas sp. TaxID=2022749 RepID=UPI002630FAD1|nr:SDR family NAD(P)-dependent oxidoreductase [Sulfurimonas sp.]MCW8895462.1 SDR family NAD(P)-dependent oxidoreductase [Sulfurimonas sp.]